MHPSYFVPILSGLFIGSTTVFAGEWSVSVQPDTVIREVKLANILGGNMGLWYTPDQIKRVNTPERMSQWRPGLLRFPGGSWGDEIYWNGNGVREGKDFDHSKFADTKWEIDYSGYAPGFRVVGDGTLSDFHGGLDVEAAHRAVKAYGSKALVTVNAGMGDAEMAAEWVRWANITNDFAVEYWEVGNELEGQWEKGHYLPDGTEMTAEIYAARYEEFAKAMKAVDPTIKVGGPAASNDQIVFGDAMLERCPELIDFISYHTYPIGAGTTDPTVMFERADSIIEGIEKLRKNLKAKAPDHADQMEIGITEWHVGVHEGFYTVDQVSGPWCAKWIGRMIEAGVDFANIWDFFSTTPDGGHGVFERDDQATPRGAFWALALWNQHMSGTLLASEIVGESGLSCFATRNSLDGTSLLLINERVTEPASVTITLGDTPIAPGTTLQAYELSSANYLWDEIKHRPHWSHPPVPHQLTVDPDGRISVPPFSAMVVYLNAQPEEPRNSPPTTAAPQPGLLLPEKQTQDLPVHARITLTNPDTGRPFLGAPQQVEIAIEGPLELEGPTTRTLHRPLDHLTLKATGGGTGTITIKTGKLESKDTIELIEVVEKQEVIFPFEEESDLEHAITSFAFNHKNGAVTIDLSKRKTDELGKKNRLLEFKELPEADYSATGGVVLRVKVTGDLPADPHAKILVILQSKANHWMSLGQIKLSDLGSDDFTDHSLRIPNPEFLDAMGELYGITLMVQSTEPFACQIHLDHIGLITRH